MKRFSPFRSSRLVSTALALSLLAGCDPEAPATDDSDFPATGPIFAVISQDPTSGNSYIVLTQKVDEAAKLPLDKAVSVTGRALGSGIAKTGSVFVGNDDQPILTRYTLSAKGRLEESGKIDLSSHGVTGIGEYQENFQFISETKAYYFDGSTSRVVVWNPKELTVTKTIDLTEALKHEGNPFVIFSQAPVRRDNQVIMPVSWRNSDATVVKQAGVVSVDTRTDTATVVTDSRCGYTQNGVIGTDGQVYLASEIYASAAHRVAPTKNPAPCLLKFNPDTLQFDPDFQKNMNELVGGAAAGALYPISPGTVYMRALDESKTPAASFNNARVLASGAGWAWWKLDFTSWTATKLEAFPATTGSVFLFPADNQVLYTEFATTAEEGTTTTLHVLGDNGKAAAKVSGRAFSFLQLR